MDGSVFGVEVTELHSVKLEQYREMELVVEFPLDLEAFHHPIQNPDWMSSQRQSMGCCDL